MTRRLVSAALAWSIVAGTACGPPQDDDPAKQEAAVLSARAARLANALAHPDSGAERGKAVARWLLPRDLKEISGLALTPDGRLLAHGDEWGTVWEIDYRRGVVVKRFTLGHEPVKGDFESIAIVDDRIFLFTSKGILYEFKEGADGAHVDYTTLDTGLRDVCEIEGMAWEASSRSLLFACKDAKEKSLKDSLVIFRWKLDTEKARGLSLPRLTVPIAQVIGANGWDHVKPSDITVDPKSGNYVLVASKDKELIEITPAGKVVASGPLPGQHDQAEGVAITPDGLLIVSDEGPIGPAVITMYRRP